MNFSRLLIAVLLFAASPVFAEGIKPVMLMYGAASTPGSTVIFSQTAYDSTYDLSTYYVGVRFELTEALGTTTMTFEPNFATVGTTCEIRLGSTVDLTTYIVADTFTPTTGVNTVQITTGNLSAAFYTVGFHCDGGTIRRNTEVDANLTTRFAIGSWNLSSSSAAYDLTLRGLKP